MQKLAIIAGPTAVGKSAVAIEVAALLNGEIISADSMQVYRKMNIGTAKLDQKEMIAENGEFIPHHLIDVVFPDEDFSVADFKREVEALIPLIIQKGKLPILVGGTGLYIESVIDPYEFAPMPVNEELRKSLRKEAQLKGPLYLHNRLREVDPISAEKLHPNDLRRVIRALEVYYQSGVPISHHAVSRKKKELLSRYLLSYIGLRCERSYLYERINRRVDKMMGKGLVQEVKGLLDEGYSPDLTSLQGLGYKQIIGYLQGHYDLE
ncbi:MAG: tRNA (adenosine(37)-N6)-dimethylallyltransferase MiaA, partial [Clostridia bacterium]|nr:tRNA (adenosine(37)-N6)-dimethylallyltransferase MiaA [Clostridia bacterium]